MDTPHPVSGGTTQSRHVAPSSSSAVMIPVRLTRATGVNRSWNEAVIVHCKHRSTSSALPKEICDSSGLTHRQTLVNRVSSRSLVYFMPESDPPPPHQSGAREVSAKWGEVLWLVFRCGRVYNDVPVPSRLVDHAQVSTKRIGSVWQDRMGSVWQGGAW